MDETSRCTCGIPPLFVEVVMLFAHMIYIGPKNNVGIYTEVHEVGKKAKIYRLMTSCCTHNFLCLFIFSALLVQLFYSIRTSVFFAIYTRKRSCDQTGGREQITQK